MLKRWRYLVLSLIVIVLDAWTKAYLKAHLMFGLSYKVFPGLNLTLAYNRGAAFSFLNSASGWQQWLFSLIAIFVVIFLLVWISRLPTQKNWQAIGASLIIGGALGNVLSRFYYGYVIDFIDVYVGSWHWPAFNVADIAICVGVIILLVDTFLRR